MYKCETCRKAFNCERNYQRHVDSKSHALRKENKDTLFECYCGKTFRQSAGLSRHKKTCEEALNNKNQVKDEISVLKEYILAQEKEKDELRNQISLLLDKYADMDVVPTIENQNHIETQQNHIETQQNIENQNNIENLTNIVVNINSFGNENIDYLDDDTVIDCIKQLHNSVPAIIEKVHFHPKHPENHNIQVTNKKLPYAKVMGKNQKWKTMNRSDAIDRMITNGYNILDDAYGEHKDKFSEFKQTVFEDFQKKYLDDDKQTHKKLRTSVDTLILNEGLS